MVTAPTGHRSTHSAQRMHRSSFFMIADASARGVSLQSLSSTARVLSSARSRLTETIRRQPSGQTSTHPPHSRHFLLSKIVLTPQSRQRAASSLASSGENGCSNSTTRLLNRRSTDKVGTDARARPS